MRNSLTVFLLLCSMAAAASPPDWSGVWSGTLDSDRIMVCNNGNAAASYHHLSAGKPLALVFIDGQWHESGTDAVWTLDGRDAQRHGTRLDPYTGSMQTLSLSRMDEVTGIPCASAHYQKTLAVQPILSIGKLQTFEDQQFRTLTAQPGPYAQVKAVTVEVLNEHPVIARLNQSWAQALPQTEPDWLPYRSCISSSLASEADSGQYVDASSLIFVSSRWLSLQRSLTHRCGEAQSSRQWGYRTWNLDSGEEADLWSWFGLHEAFASQPFQRSWSRLTPGLRRIVQQDKEIDSECRVLNQGDSWYALRPGVLGLIFERVGGSPRCEEEVEVSWSRLQGQLTAAGKKAVHSLSSSIQQ